MHSSGFYEVANKEKRMRTSRDQSYKLCTTTLFILLLLLLFIIIGNVLWNRKNYYHYSYSNMDSLTVNEPTIQNDYKEHLGTTTKTEKQLVNSRVELTNDEKKGKEGLSERYVVNTTEPYANYSTESIIATEKQYNSVTFNEKYAWMISASENNTETTVTNINFNTTQTSKISADLRVEFITTNENETETTMSYFSDNIKTSTRVLATQTSNTKPTATNENETETTVFYVSDNVETSTTMSLTQTSDISTNIKTEADTQSVVSSSEVAFTSVNSTELFTNDSATKSSNISDQLVESDQVNLCSTNENSTTPKLKETVVNSESKKIAQVCDSSNCKRTAAKMLSYMNHSADPCEDFYEYACGGMQADPQIIDKNFMSRVHERIAKQMLKNDSSKASYLFKTYYENCKHYEGDLGMEERVNLAKEALRKLGQFYTTENWSRNENHEFTKTYANLLLNYRALLFDVAPDLDEYSSSFYPIRVGPVFEKSPFDTETTVAQDPCYAEQQIELQTLSFVDLKTLYDNYKMCKDNNTSFIHSVSETLRVLGVFNSSENVTQYIDQTTTNVDLEIMAGLFSRLPTKSAAREAFLMKNYTSVSLKDLEDTIKLVNWTKLIYSLTSRTVNPQEKLQIYFYDELREGLHNLTKFQEKDPMNFHNAVMALYARSIYQELVLSKHSNVEQHCFRVATSFLKPEASTLYLSSLSDAEIARMNHTIFRVFNLLKKTINDISHSENDQWLDDTEYEDLLKKIDQLKPLIPTISDFIIKDTEESLNLSNNYLDNSMALIKRHRNSIYSIIKTQTDSLTAEQIWTRYATPFQSTAVAIYGLNLVIIPLGVMDYDVVDVSNTTEKNTLDYLTLATVGTLIAHQISRHFDTTGIHYLNDAQNSQLLTNSYLEQYFEFYRNVYKKQINITLPWNSQTVSVKIPESTLNERLSETMALRLSHDTLTKGEEKSHLEKQQLLPWLNLDMDQLFYLAYAQMYCTKRLLTDSYVSLYEQEELPSRIRVFVSMSSEERVGEKWTCPQGSQIVPSIGYCASPYLEKPTKDEKCVVAEDIVQ